MALTFAIDDGQSSPERTLEIRDLVIAEWTGRDEEAMEKHIAELEATGVPARPRPHASIASPRIN